MAKGLNPVDLVEIPQGKVRAIWLAPAANQSELKKKTLPEFEVDGFLMMAKQVSRQQFLDFLNKNPGWRTANANSLFVDASYLKDVEFNEKTRNWPITFVSWFAARTFCQAMDMRLPTVVEWEYVAAASEIKKDANQDPQFLKRILQWYGEPQDGNFKEVGSIYKNIYGVWDMHGLVWEWTDDFNSSFVTGESRADGSLNKDMFCGGGAISSGDKENYAAFMRFAFRSSLQGRSSMWNLGFRCVRDL